MDIKKIPDLSKYIDSFRKNKSKKTQNKTQQPQKPEFKKEDQLKNIFDKIYQDVVGNLVNMTDDFYPESEENMHKKYAAQLGKIKPI